MKDAEAQHTAVEKVRRTLMELGCKTTDAIDSPILGMEGNREFLLMGVF